MVTTPNMGLSQPTINVDSGLTWEQQVNNNSAILDTHNHTPGSGVQINPSGINLNADLPFNNNNLTLARSLRLSPQTLALSGPLDLGCLYEAGVDLYFNDGAGNQIRITSGGSVAGASGTITGLPSGTASASYSAGTFVFQSATSTSANIDGQSFILRNNLASSKGLTLSPPNAMGANYSLVLPALPGTSGNFVTIDTSGNMGSSVSVDNITTQVSSNLLSVKVSGLSGITGSQIASATITGSNIASATVAGSNIASATITGTNIASQINLPGKAVKENGLNIICSNANATNGLSMLRGQLVALTDASNHITSASRVGGEGWSVTSTTNTTIVVNMATPLADTAYAVCVTPSNIVLNPAVTSIVDTADFIITVGGLSSLAPSAPFTLFLIVLGQRNI